MLFIIACVFLALFMGFVTFTLFTPASVLSRLQELDYRHPFASWRELVALEHRYWEVRAAYDLYFGSRRWKENTDAFLAARGHLPLTGSHWTEYHWGGKAMAPPRDAIVEDTLSMALDMAGDLSCCKCPTCRRVRLSDEDVDAALLAAGIPLKVR